MSTFQEALNGDARLADAIHGQLRAAILSGQCAPGEHLREVEIADRYDVSRGPVREALLQLEREGLVLLRRNRGAVVARLSRADLEEVYSLRLALERLAVAQAARMAPRPISRPWTTCCTSFAAPIRASR